MLRSESKSVESKISLTENCLPKMSGEYLGVIISKYHALKNEEAGNRKLHIKMPMSKKMQALENFFTVKLKSETRLLNDEECFELIKILFSSNKNDGLKTKSAIYLILFNYFHPAVVAALDSAVAKVGNVDSLHDYIGVICKHPQDAASIVYAVLLLSDIKNAAAKLGRTKDLFTNQMLESIITDHNLAVSIVETYQTLYKAHAESGEVLKVNPKHGKLSEIIMHDILLHISLKLVQANQFSLEVFNRLKNHTYYDLKDIAKQITKNPKEVIDKYLSRTAVESNMLTRPPLLFLGESQVAFDENEYKQKEMVVSKKTTIDENQLPKTLSLK